MQLFAHNNTKLFTPLVSNLAECERQHGGLKPTVDGNNKGAEMKEWL